MQVVHTIKLSTEECDALFEIAEKAGAVKESTAFVPEEKIAKQTDLRMQFEDALHILVAEAFEYGYNVGMGAANKKDTEMYKPTM